VRLGEASEVYRILDEAGRPYTLIAIAREWLLRESRKSVSKTIVEAFQLYRESHSHRSKVYLGQLKTIQSRFVGLPLLSELEPKDIEKVLEPFQAGTKNRYIRILRAVLTYAQRKGLVHQNVAQLLDFAVMPQRSIHIFSNAQIEGMLKAALASDIDMLPFFSLGAFAGIRVGSPELLELLWSDISLDEKLIVIRQETAKTKKKRLIPISDNLEAWLRLYLQKKGKTPRLVMQKTFYDVQASRKEIFKKVSPGKVWTPAGLRHTYASSMINSGRTIDETCLALGHVGSPTLLHNHYFLPGLKSQALAYWQILPQ
jgi:integrase